MDIVETAAASADLPITTKLIRAIGFVPGVHTRLGDVTFDPIASTEGLVAAIAALERQVAELRAGA
jgi:hypothetical protein